MPCEIGRYAFSSTNCNEIDSRHSFTTANRTASQARSVGKRRHDLAYPRLHDSNSRLFSAACSCPETRHVPRQLDPRGNREGCGKAMSSARTVGMKNGQAKKSPWNLCW